MPRRRSNSNLIIPTKKLIGQQQIVSGPILPGYYIDFDNGNDSNPGTKSLPWQRHPFMAGFSGSYSHSAGDRFYFKGGTTWPVSCFQMLINMGGNLIDQDYYGVDLTWYSGGSFSRPVFDFQETKIGGGLYGAGIWINTGQYIVFEYLELKSLFADTADYGAMSIAMYGVVDHILITNCIIRDWVMPNPLGANQDNNGMGGVGAFGGGTGSNIEVSFCTLHQNNVTSKCGCAIRNIPYLNFSEIYETTNAYLGGGIIHDNHLYDLTAPSDPNSHCNAIETFSAAQIYNNLIHDLDAHVAPILLNPDVSGGGETRAYNNVLWNTGGQTPLALDNQTGDLSIIATCSLLAYNNTIVSDTTPIRVVYRPPGETFLALDCKNNHLITTSTAIGHANHGAGWGDVTTFVDENNYVETSTQATSDGYLISNQFQPTSIISPTYQFGQDLSVYFTFDRLNKTRNVPFDAGAYQF